LAGTHEQAGQWKEAESRYLELLAVHPVHLAALRRLTSLYFGLIDDPAKAMNTARRLREQAPGDPDALRLLGRAAARSGDLKWALSLFRDGVEAAPDNAALKYSLGQTAYLGGYLREAEQALEQALSLDAAASDAVEARRLLSLMRIYREKDTSEDARALVRTAMADAQLELPARMASAAQSAAAGEIADARTAYESILGAWPNFAPALADLAALYADTREMQERAWELASKAREMLPDDPTVAALFGGLASRRGQHDWAVSVLSEAVRAGTADADVYYSLGNSEFHRGNKEAARRHLEEALRRADAGFAHAEDARRLLAEIAGN
jgi:tetratricopeptide (TPR) repeat protein